MVVYLLILKLEEHLSQYKNGLADWLKMSWVLENTVKILLGVFQSKSAQHSDVSLDILFQKTLKFSCQRINHPFEQSLEL